jgi:hypothetical protein
LFGRSSRDEVTAPSFEYFIDFLYLIE